MAALMIEDEGKPPEAILRQMLAEGHDGSVMAVTGEYTIEIAKWRRELGVPNRWLGGRKRVGRTLALAVTAVMERRWIDWQEQPPDPISDDELEQLVRMELGLIARPEPPKIVEPDQHRIATAARLLSITEEATDARIAFMTNYTEEQVHRVMWRFAGEFIRQADGSYRRYRVPRLRNDRWTPERVQLHVAAITPASSAPWREAFGNREVLRFVPMSGIPSDAPLEPWNRRPTIGWAIVATPGTIWRCTDIHREADRAVYVMTQQLGEIDEEAEDMAAPDPIRIKAAAEQLIREGQQPTDADVAEMTDYTEQQVHNVLLRVRDNYGLRYDSDRGTYHMDRPAGVTA